MADNSENILVEFDFQNIIIIDPNKVLDSEGKVKDRLVKQENLVMYANLEATVLPRTKLANNTAANDAIETIKIAQINFLNPGNQKFMNNSYTNEGVGFEKLTKDKVNGEIDNSRKSENAQSQTKMSDDGLLGITSIEININTAFMPQVNIEFEDVKGRALFEQGNNSPYAAFFNLPYPLFYLTIKGYYGKAIRLPLMLQNFTSRYDTVSGNYKISTKFLTYKYTMLQEISMGYLLATPHMYKSRVKIAQRTQSGGNKTVVYDDIVELGYQKIKEVYSDYKAKGLIAADFPELTIVQLATKLDNLINNVLESFTKQNLAPIDDIQQYQNDLIEYQKEVYYAVSGGKSWFNRYMDVKNSYVTKGTKKPITFYTFLPSISDSDKISAINELNAIVEKYTAKFVANKTLGKEGSYKVNGKVIKIHVPVKVSPKTFYYSPSPSSVDLEAKYKQQNNNSQPTAQKLTSDFLNQITSSLNAVNITNSKGETVNTNQFFFFEGPNSFIDLTSKMLTEVNVKRSEIEDSLTQALSQQIQTKNNGIGFIPTMRNCLAVVFASGEAFLRLMDDVHKSAWDKRDDPIRRRAILNGLPTSDDPKNGDNDTPIYPWPQYLEETTDDKAQNRYDIKYPGDSKSIGVTKGYLYDVWPEVEFVEEFIKGFVQRDIPSPDPSTDNNQKTQVSKISLDGIQAPLTDEIYLLKQEVKFIYEIYERIYLEAFYSKFDRGNSNGKSVYQAFAEVEKNNVVISLSNDNPFLIKKLRDLNLNSANYVPVLRHISNDGTGESWQNYLRGIFNTNYIKDYVKHSFNIFDINELELPTFNPIVSLTQESNFESYVVDTSTNDFDFSDTYPFTESSWYSQNLSNGLNIGSNNSVFTTKNVLQYNSNKKKVTNFQDSDDTTQKRPVTNFNYLNVTVPTLLEQSNLTLFYTSRSKNYDKQFPTEGNLFYENYSGETIYNQTTSMMNTPYFVNAIQKGVENFRNFDKYPYREAAYLFLNSLPLATFREKYSSYDTSQKPLDYIFATFKKFSGLHKVPFAWVLKYGSIWHRYKTWKDTGNDLLTPIWSNFDYLKNFDPVNSASTTTYKINVNGVTYPIVLQESVVNSGQTTTRINTGFYPKLIDDFSVFYLGSRLFNSGYSNQEIQKLIDDKFLYVNFSKDTLTQRPNGFDLANTGRTLSYTPWTSYITTDDQKSFYFVPTNGLYSNSVYNDTINQSIQECFNKNTAYQTIKVELENNNAFYNGSVRLFWEAPNYGYFDSDRLRQPNPDEYLKNILSAESQYNFAILNNTEKYTDISDVFSVFEKSILDIMENEFLEYSKSRYDFSYKSTDYKIQEEILKEVNQYKLVTKNCDTGINEITDSSNIIEQLANKLNVSVDYFTKIALGGIDATTNEVTSDIAGYRNFHIFMTNNMKVGVLTGNTFNDVVKGLGDSQRTTLLNGLKGMMEYDTVLKHGNPSQFDKKLFYTFSTQSFLFPYTYETYFDYSPDALPASGKQITLADSKANYPDAWKALETYVGFSNIPQLVYTENGSYITDFFIDMNVEFKEQNVIDFAPIIKIYATQKLKNNSLNKSTFLNLMDGYITNLMDFDTNILNSAMLQIRTGLGSIKEEKISTIDSQLEGYQTKVEFWETFKGFNDKWIAGTDVSEKTFFEDVLILDRASRDIGDKVLVDIIKLKAQLTDINPKTPMLTTVQSILMDNHFVIFNTPSYVNFYNVQDVSKNPTPSPEGTTEFASTMFGTFLDVDYRKTGPKMVCLYGDIPSSTLAVNDQLKNDFRFNNDAFEITKAQNNPIVEKLDNKTDWALSNKVVGFNVDIGVQNQQIFNNFSVSQDNGQSTAESLQLLYEMANQGGGKSVGTQNVSLYNLYKNRSYQCQVTMLGNAIVQPTMYFNLRYVPMYTGPYMITDVKHSIQPGTFTTVVTGVRQRVSSLPVVDSYIQSLKNNLLQPLILKAQTEKATKDKEVSKSNNVVEQKKEVTQSADTNKTPVENAGLNDPNQTDKTNANGKSSVDSTTGSCSNKLAKVYKDKYNPIQSYLTSRTHKEVADTIHGLANTGGYLEPYKLELLIFATIYLNCGDDKGLQSYNHNLTGVKLNEQDGNWGPNDACNGTPVGGSLYWFPKREFICLQTNGENPTPYAVFETDDKNILMLLERWNKRTSQIKQSTTNVTPGLVSEITKFWILNFTSDKRYTYDADGNIVENVYSTMDKNQLSNLETKVNTALKIYKSLY
jgi:hypothetical protein